MCSDNAKKILLDSDVKLVHNVTQENEVRADSLAGLQTLNFRRGACITMRSTEVLINAANIVVRSSSHSVIANVLAWINNIVLVLSETVLVLVIESRQS
jgi:hypothetical protein